MFKYGIVKVQSLYVTNYNVIYRIITLFWTMYPVTVGLISPGRVAIVLETPSKKQAY